MPKVARNTRQPWRASDMRLIRQLLKQGMSTRAIADQLGRSVSSLYQRASLEGLSLRIPKKTSRRSAAPSRERTSRRHSA